MKKIFSVCSIVLAALFICLFLDNCKKPERVIKIITLDVSPEDINYEKIVIKGEIIDPGKGVIRDHGIALRKADESEAGFNEISLGPHSGEGVFIAEFNNPGPETSYEYKAFAEDGSEKVYGKSKTLTSLALSIPVLTTADVTEIKTDAATSGGEITSNGGSEITARGICWSTEENPDTDNEKSVDPNPGTGVFVNHLSSLTPNTVYYVRAYATNSVGTAYGNQVAFTTLAITQPVLTTAEVSEITNTAATSGGDITSDGGSEITARGICWSTEENPDTNNEKSIDPNPGSGEFVNHLSGLSPGTIYYVRAYASNIAGTGYGNQVAFKSLEGQLNYINAGGGVTDIDGNIYASVIIGGQEWMAENLKTETYKDGTGISTGLSNADWQTDASGAFSLYPYSGVSGISTDMDMRDAYGLLYNWYAVDNSSGLCPDGWRMPAHDDWNQLVDYLIGNYDEIDASNTGVYLKSCRQPGSPLGGDCDTYDQPYWEPDNIYYGTDNFGFAALPGGYRSPEGDFYDLGGYAYWWSSTEDQGSYAFAHTMYCDAGEVNVASDDKEYGYSVRCIKEAPSQNLATLTTTAVTGIIETSATVGGNVTDDGGATVTDRGIYYGTSSGPETTGTKLQIGSGTGVFSTSLTGLSAGTTYYIKAYATNSVGTSYGSEVSFTTNDAIAPSVTTVSVTGITDNSADCTGNVTDNGSSVAGDRGFCYNTSGNPTIADSIVQNNVNGTGEFTETIDGLDPGTTYYVRAYGKNSEGTGYGDQIEFTTLALPTISTETVINIEYTTAESGGNITDNGGSAVTARGICWGMGPAPDLTGNHTTDGSGTGSYPSTMTGLDPGTTYYVIAYATNSVGTVYGQEETFTTKSLSTATVNTGNAYNITDVSATVDGDVTDDGGAGITERGICYDTISSPTIADNVVTVAGDTGSFSVDLTFLTPGTTYYCRAYAINSLGTGYGNEVSFTTYDITDYDGNNYNAVTIGNQVWMAENLKVTHYSNGTAIPLVEDNAAWDALGISDKAYCYYDNSSVNGDTYGALYTWAAAMNGASSSNANPSGVQGVCPDGWHLPGDAEWKELEMYLGMSQADADTTGPRGTDEGSQLAGNSTLWRDGELENDPAFGSSGYTALPGGFRGNSGSLYYLGDNAALWSAAEYNSSYAYRRRLSYNSSDVLRYYGSKGSGFSVRCVKD